MQIYASEPIVGNYGLPGRNMQTLLSIRTKVESFTHGVTYDVQVNKKYLNEGENVLIIDDFLARGEALNGLIDLCNQAGANVVGCGVGVEKAFQPGGDNLRNKGYKVASLARVKSMNEQNGIEFA